MGIIERISPKWAYQREAYKTALAIRREAIKERSYDAGRYDRMNRNWDAHNDSGEAIDRPYRDTVRARSRDLERNSDLMNANIHPWIRAVVGKGFTLEAQTDNEALNTNLEKLWAKWCKKDNCDVSGSMSFWEMARMAVRRKRVDGGIIFVKCYTEGGVLPFKLQALEVDELDSSHFAPHEKGNRVVGGVEYTTYNKAVGYWIREYDIEGYTSMTARYVPRERVIFYFSKTRPTQVREMPEMAATISRIKEVNGYIEAASVKERIAACLAVFIKKALPSGQLGRPAAAGAPKHDYNELELTPGLITELNDGDELQVVNPGAGATDGGGFIKSMLRLISAGQGISYEAASRDLTQANYSSARQATIEDEETFAPEIDKIKDEILDEVYREFVISAVISGAVKAPADFWGNIDAYTAHEWNRKPKRWIDPQKEANANKIALQTGQKTPKDIWSEDGRDYKTVIDELSEVQEYARKKGVLSALPYLTGGTV